MIPPEYLNQIVTGDARELAKRIPDKSIDLIFTDPVYDQIEDYDWLAETARRILTPGGNLVAFCSNNESVRIALEFMGRGFDFCDWLIYREMARRRKIWGKNINGLYELACWVSNGSDRLGSYVANFSYVSNGYAVKSNEWAKEASGLVGWIGSLSIKHSTVFDPFTGGGTVPAVCKILGRNYVAFEIDAVTAEKARNRVANTQPPLFVAQPEQLELVAASSEP